MVEIRFADTGDLRALMMFMHEHWRADHILSRNEALFRFDFEHGDRLNLAIAESGQQIVGLFGYMRYSDLDEPDIAGSLWKVLDGVGSPMLGLQLRRFVTRHVPHRFFAAPGAGLQTRAIYRLLGMHWIEMDQFFVANPDVRRRRLCRIGPARSGLTAHESSVGWCFDEIDDPHALSGFPFLSDLHRGPLKDWAYLRRRFFTHPIYRYRVFRLAHDGESVNIVVCREVGHDGARALRVVDFYGAERHMQAIVAALYEIVRREGFEYVDFVCSGFDRHAMCAAGWQAIDFARSDVVVPNYFEPFVMSNVRVYAVADVHPAISARLCRADGDQDRPNIESGTGLSEAS